MKMNNTTSVTKMQKEKRMLNLFWWRIVWLVWIIFFMGNVSAQVTATCRNACTGMSPVTSCGDGYVFSFTFPEWQTNSQVEVLFNGTNIFNQSPSWTLANCTSVTWEAPYLQISKQAGSSPETWYILINPTTRTVTASNQAPACGNTESSTNTATQTAWIYGDNTATLMPSTANAGIGNTPLSNAKLRLYNSSAATDTIFGLHTTVENATSRTTSTQPQYSIYSSNINSSSSNNKIYGAYFKNTQTGSTQYASGTIYGVYLDNNNTRYGNTIYGAYTNNNAGGYGCSTYGYYANNTISSPAGTVYGFYANNTSTNTGTAGLSIYGAYLSSTSAPSANSSVYGLYATVSGANENNRYAGYFTGGKVAVMNGNVGIGTTTPTSELEVVGGAKISGSVGIGGDPGTATLRVKNTTLPNFILEGANNNRLQIGVAMDNGNFASFALPGDIVFRPMGQRHGLIFNLPNSSNNGNSYIKFGDDANGGWFSILNNKTVLIDGKVGIGTSTPFYKLDVNGIIRAREVLINVNTGADFVFDENYTLKPLDEVRSFIQSNRRLPEIPSAADMLDKGLDMGEFQIKLLQKIEELTLYVIEQDKRIKELERNVR